MKKCLVLLSVFVMNGAMAERWDRYNNPAIFQPIMKNQMNFTLSKLPLKAALKDDRLGWSESYWPSNMGGIAYRWNHPDPQPFNYRLHTKEEVVRMSEEELSQLSPAELYDIAQGNYDYPLTKKVLSRYSPRDLWWEGICHGWAVAAARFPEPDKTIVMNNDGVKVPFGSSDVKALLSMHDAFNTRAYNVLVGRRCKASGKVPGEGSVRDTNRSFPSERSANSKKCKEDVNAGSFHVILTNMIGLNGLGFVADVDRFGDVWNQPVTSYETQINEELPLTANEARKGVSKKVRVTTKFIYGEELMFYSPKEEAAGHINFVSKEPVTGTPHQAFKFKNYEYTLELDAAGKIIGGEWISVTRPDMLWTKAKDQNFYNSPLPLAGLSRIYTPVTR